MKQGPDALWGALFLIVTSVAMMSLCFLVWLYDNVVPYPGQICRDLLAARAMIRIRRSSARALRAMAAEARRWQPR